MKRTLWARIWTRTKPLQTVSHESAVSGTFGNASGGLYHVELRRNDKGEEVLSVINIDGKTVFKAII